MQKKISPISQTYFFDALISSSVNTYMLDESLIY